MIKTALPFLAAGLFAVLFADSCGESKEGAVKDSPATVSGESAQEVPAVKRSSGELIVGKWLMLKEEPADGKGGFFEQTRRLLTINDDGKFHVENMYSGNDGTWVLQGERLLLTTTRAAELQIQVEKLDEKILVVVEDLPEIYLRDGPPRKVRNTYRRVSESELGPMLGKKVVTTTPTAGEYKAAYEYKMTKYPTMEIYISEGIQGRVRLTLKEDGTVEGCYGVVNGRHSSRSKYSSPDGKHHSTDEEERWLSGFRGKWKPGKGIASVKLDRFWRDTCDTTRGEGESFAVEIECRAFAPNEKLPVAGLACRLINDFRLMREIAINPADTERAGPYTLQSSPMGHIFTDKGRPWLLLGAAPGLKVKSEDGRDNRTPEVTFIAEEVTIVEGSYIPKKPLPQ